MTGEGKILKTGDSFSIICMQCGIPTCKQDFIINSQKLHNCCCSRHSDARGRFWSQAFSSLASSMSGWLETRGDTGQNGRHNSLHRALGNWIGFVLNWCRDKVKIPKPPSTHIQEYTHWFWTFLVSWQFVPWKKHIDLPACGWAERMGRSGRCISPVIVGQSGVRYATSSWKKRSQNCGSRTLEKACFCVGFCSDFDSTKWYIVNYSEKVNSWTWVVSHCQRQWPPLTSEVPLTSEDFLFGESIVWGLCHHPLAIDVRQILVWRRQCKHYLEKIFIWIMKCKTLFGKSSGELCIDEM